MLKEELLEYLISETAFEELGDEKGIIRNEVFGEEIGRAINGGDEALLEFSCELSEKLLDMDVYKASVVTNFIGFVCEKTQNTKAAKGVIDFLAKSSGLVKEFFGYLKNEQDEIIDEDEWNTSEIYNKNKDAVCAYYGFNILCVSAMAFLSRDNSYRNYLKTLNVRENILYLAEEATYTDYTKSVYYINRMYDTCGIIPLIVLDEERKQGVVAQANDINNCFHLIFLLEEALYKGYGEKYNMENYVYSEVLSSIAGGEYPECNEQSVHIFFNENFHTGKKDKEKNQNMYSILWGEMPPICIPIIDGYGIIKLKNKGPHRCFSPDFLYSDHTALSPYVKILRELSKEEYEEWYEKFGNE